MFFWVGGGSLPLSGYVLRPPALRAYAATPSGRSSSKVLHSHINISTHQQPQIYTQKKHIGAFKCLIFTFPSTFPNKKGPPGIPDSPCITKIYDRTTKGTQTP